MEDSRQSSALDQCYAAADPSPRLVAGKHTVGFELVRRCEHQSVRKPRASGLAAQMCCRTGDRGSHLLDVDSEVSEERLDFGHGLGSSAIRRDEDLGIHGQRDHELVVLMLCESLHRGGMECIVGVEKGNDDRRVEDD